MSFQCKTYPIIFESNVNFGSVNSIPQFLFFGPRIINEMQRRQKGEDMCGLGVSLGQLTMEF